MCGCAPSPRIKRCKCGNRYFDFDKTDTCGRCKPIPALATAPIEHVEFTAICGRCERLVGGMPGEKTIVFSICHPCARAVMDNLFKRKDKENGERKE